MSEEGDGSEGFWIRLWFDKERSSKIEENYIFLLYKDGYEKNDEKLLKIEVQEWSQKLRYNSEFYRYGYDLVEKPPVEWLKKALKRIKSKQELLEKQEKLINQLLGDSI